MAQIIEITNPLTGLPQQVIQSDYTAQEIDDAVERIAATPGDGAISAEDVGAAPSGYGLGTTAAKAPTVNDLDSIVQTGWYVGVPVMPGFSFGNTAVMHVAMSLNYATQIAFLYSATSATPKNSLLVRAKEGGVWGTWEWVNPPVQLGIEYRTTERYNGNPVYAQLVNFGALPNSGGSVVAHNINNVSTVIYGNLCTQDGIILITFPNITQFTISRTSITVRTNSDLSSNLCTVLMKYTKTTN